MFARFETRCVFRRDSGSLTFDVPPAETSASDTSAWRAVARVLRSPLDALSCALLPSCCALCGSPLPRLSSAPICDVCWIEVPVLGGAACARCGDSLDEPGELCRACRTAPPPFEKAVAYAFYQDSMRGAIHALKYERMHAASKRMGAMLAQAIEKLHGEASAEMLVVPVPLHRRRYAERGFNQARELAGYALAALRTSHPEWLLTLAPAALMRLRATEAQATLTPRQRRLNVRGAFQVSDGGAVRDRHVLLVDDILTTGATARAAAKALKDAGAATVWVATLARARRHDAVKHELMQSVDSLGQRSF